MAQVLPSNTFTTAKFIVSATASDGTHTTIGAALTSAASGDTIFIRPGTYTENLTLKNGVSLVGYNRGGGSGAGTTIIGKMIDNGGNVITTLSNFTLQTNSDFIIQLTGSTSTVALNGCKINCTNNTGITVATGTGVSADLCTGDLGTTGIGFSTGAGSVQFNYCSLTNSGASITNTTTSGGLTFTHSFIASPIGTTGSGTINLVYTSVNTAAQNNAALTTAGTGSATCWYSLFRSGSASAVSSGTGTTISLYECDVESSNTNAVTGIGTLNIGGITFSGSSSLINTTTQTGAYTVLGAYKAPFQPAFYAFLASNATNATGDGTTYQLGTSALTKKFDQGTNFNTNGTFTAPVAGIYYFFVNGNVGNIGAAHTEMNLSIVASGVTYNGTGGNATVCKGVAFGDYSQSMSIVVSMAANDTAVANIIVTGSTKTITILGSTSPNNWFMGYKLA